MDRREYTNIGEVLYSSVLPNGLRLNVVPKAGFSTRYAVFATNYGGAHRRFSLDGKTVDTPAGPEHSLRQWGRPQRLYLQRRDLLLFQLYGGL